MPAAFSSMPFLDGHLAVVDHGGSGSPVLLLHAPGGNLQSWHSVLPLVTETHHVYALDLPGHGQSTARPQSAFDIADAIVATCRFFELDRPVLVADDCTGYHAVLAAITSGCAGALVLISGFFLSTPTEVGGVLDLFADEQLTATIAGPRFDLGTTGRTEKEKHQLCARLQSRSGEGWLIEGAQEGALTTRLRSLLDLEDGTWVRQPRPSTLCAYFAVDRHQWFPGPALLARVNVPIHMLVSTDGADAQVAARIESGDVEPAPAHVRLHLEESGVAPRHTAPHAVAALIDEAVSDIVGAPDRPAILGAPHCAAQEG